MSIELTDYLEADIKAVYATGHAAAGRLRARLREVGERIADLEREHGPSLIHVRERETAFSTCKHPWTTPGWVARYDPDRKFEIGQLLEDARTIRHPAMALHYAPATRASIARRVQALTLADLNTGKVESLAGELDRLEAGLATVPVDVALAAGAIKALTKIFPGAKAHQPSGIFMAPPPPPPKLRAYSDTPEED